MNASGYPRGDLMVYKTRGWCRLELLAALVPKKFHEGGWRPGPISLTMRFHDNPEEVLKTVGPALDETFLFNPLDPDIEYTCCAKAMGRSHDCDRTYIVPLVRCIAVQFCEYIRSGATEWDSCIECNRLPKWFVSEMNKIESVGRKLRSEYILSSRTLSQVGYVDTNNIVGAAISPLQGKYAGQTNESFREQDILEEMHDTQNEGLTVPSSNLSSTMTNKYSLKSEKKTFRFVLNNRREKVDNESAGAEEFELGEFGYGKNADDNRKRGDSIERAGWSNNPLLAYAAPRRVSDSTTSKIFSSSYRNEVPQQNSESRKKHLATEQLHF